MAIEIVWTEYALKNKIEIFNYWNDRNKSNEYSIKLNNLIDKRIELLQSFPLIGKLTEYENTRHLVVRDYLIIYKVELEIIYIITIWDSRQNPDTLTKIFS